MRGFEKMIYHFGYNDGYFFSNRNLRLTGISKEAGQLRSVTFELLLADCLQLQSFLINAEMDDYGVHMADVKCGRLAYSACVATVCPDFEKRGVLRRKKCVTSMGPMATDTTGEI
ncbi:hypothetical protein RB195_012169 [Necator americanus]|uniref:Uncharacterized protein n=1 Tax=Necator americanus TaxID=51031 RepID=A0ABR1D5U5_NECAM